MVVFIIFIIVVLDKKTKQNLHVLIIKPKLFFKFNLWKESNYKNLCVILNCNI